VLTHASGWRLVYSGDTRPSTELIAAGAGATLLVHEATFGDGADARAHAQVKMHSTLGEALHVAKQCVACVSAAGASLTACRMGARNTLLTHFSGRYPHVSPKTAATAHGAHALALDGLRLRIGDVWKMPLYEPAIRALMSRGEDEDDENAAVRGMMW
jgi:ribonuclease Z